MPRLFSAWKVLNGRNDQVGNLNKSTPTGLHLGRGYQPCSGKGGCCGELHHQLCR